MAVSLFDLPTELLIRIFVDLDISDLVSCQLTNSSICTIISDSVVLSYLKAKCFAGIEDNSNCRLSISERLDLLVARVNAWQDISIDFKQSIEVNHDPSGIYELTGGVYLLGDDSRRALHYLTLPTKPSDVMAWSKIKVDRDVIDLALAIYEHDLLAIITTTPHLENASHIIEIELLKFSTGQPHPFARQSRLFVVDSDWPRPAISMEISGDNLALVVTYFRQNFQPNDHFYIYEWKTGVLKMEIDAPGGSFGGLVFLTPQILLLPNTLKGVFEFWKVPSIPNTAPTRPIAALGLPTLREGHIFSMLSCRGEPNPVKDGIPYAAQPFHSSPMDAIVIFNLRVQGMEVVVPGNSFSLFVHRRALFELCPDITMPQPHDEVVIPWERWGPSVTRWLGAGVMPTRWITTTCGQRCVFRLTRAGDEPSPIVVLDFNPASVKHAVADVPTCRPSYAVMSSEIVHISFQAPIVSALPYACYWSPDVFNYDGLLMDEERLIGLHTNVLDKITRVEVLHLGQYGIEEK